MMAYHSPVQCISVFPVQTLFGCDINLPVDLLLVKPPQAVVDPLSGVAYVDNLKCNLYLIHNRDMMCKASARQKRNYALSENLKSYQVGDAAYLHNPSWKKGTGGKLHSPWTGPILVVVSDLIY